MNEIYSVSNPAVEIYRKNAKNGKDIPQDILERKLTAIVRCSKFVSQLLSNKFVYRFGGFCMIVNETTKKIEVMTWDRDDHRGSISKEIQEKLKETFKLLGLNKSGDKYISMN